MKKTYSKTTLECKVTFQISAEILSGSKNVCISGDFNGWSLDANPLKVAKGEGSISLVLEPGREYQYKFVIDGNRWENDPEANRFVSNEFGEANSIVEV